MLTYHLANIVDDHLMEISRVIRGEEWLPRDVFDNYQYAHPATADFYTRFRNGEKMKTGWVNESDYEKAVIKEIK